MSVTQTCLPDDNGFLMEAKHLKGVRALEDERDLRRSIEPLFLQYLAQERMRERKREQNQKNGQC